MRLIQLVFLRYIVRNDYNYFQKVSPRRIFFYFTKYFPSYYWMLLDDILTMKFLGILNNILYNNDIEGIM